MTIQEIANRLVELCRKGDFETAHAELFADDCVSIEPDGAPVKEVRGKEGLAAKGKQFMEMMEPHSYEISDPVVADDYFSCSVMMDATFKPTGQRSQSSEIALYEVKNGKIVREEFFYIPNQG
ncbi:MULTISPECIES: nuclear transport factor 2 family protein [Flammeovirga]|uniref:Nuclear transport factor 2 family protein n=1 Tax=Flammeovirga agarivorans TaxID=2726742 RepID=A0A7X8XYB9_9BACT|nr:MULTISPECIES: nuclear transport factor 2 family protein [Flammeovirga]NLR94066.1 nuclear transport factor 2 family protein [Flammeovirga agarivorans]